LYTGSVDEKTRKAVEAARTTAKLARRRRENLRRRTRPAEPQREKSLASMIERLHRDMAPIRSAIGRIPYEKPKPRDEATLRECSEELKYERKQIRKMQRG
jgi:hypothetical protein